MHNTSDIPAPRLDDWLEKEKRAYLTREPSLLYTHKPRTCPCFLCDRERHMKKALKVLDRKHFGRKR